MGRGSEERKGGGAKQAESFSQANDRQKHDRTKELVRKHLGVEFFSGGGERSVPYLLILIL